MRFNRELIVWRDVLKIGSLCVTENVCPLAFVLLRVQIPYHWLPDIPNSIIETPNFPSARTRTRAHLMGVADLSKEAWWPEPFYRHV